MYNKIETIDVTVEYVICRNDPEKLIRFHFFNIAKAMVGGPVLEPIKGKNLPKAYILGFEDVDE